MQICQKTLDRILSRVNGEEIAQLALDLAKIRETSGHKEEIGDYAYRWMAEHGSNPYKQNVVGTRFNVIGIMPGRGRGNPATQRKKGISDGR